MHGTRAQNMSAIFGVGVASRPKGDPTSIVLPWMVTVTVVTIQCAAVSVAGRAQPPSSARPAGVSTIAQHENVNRTRGSFNLTGDRRRPRKGP